ncbi:MAG: hypothetical protein ABW201_19890 [Candidatus Thiodiazotropha sp.]
MNISVFPKMERRKKPQRLIWIAPDTHCIAPDSIKMAERRIDRDAIVVLKEIERSVLKRKTVGIVFGLMKANGRVEFGMTGMCYDSPLIASGITSKIQALTDSWVHHPMSYLPGMESQEVDRD